MSERSGAICLSFGKSSGWAADSRLSGYGCVGAFRLCRMEKKKARVGIARIRRGEREGSGDGNGEGDGKQKQWKTKSKIKG